LVRISAISFELCEINMEIIEVEFDLFGLVDNIDGKESN